MLFRDIESSKIHLPVYCILVLHIFCAVFVSCAINSEITSQASASLQNTSDMPMNAMDFLRAENKTTESILKTVLGAFLNVGEIIKHLENNGQTIYEIPQNITLEKSIEILKDKKVFEKTGVELNYYMLQYTTDEKVMNYFCALMAQDLKNTLEKGEESYDSIASKYKNLRVDWITEFPILHGDDSGPKYMQIYFSYDRNLFYFITDTFVSSKQNWRIFFFFHLTRGLFFMHVNEEAVGKVFDALNGYEIKNDGLLSLQQNKFVRLEFSNCKQNQAFRSIFTNEELETNFEEVKYDIYKFLNTRAYMVRTINHSYANKQHVCVKVGNHIANKVTADAKFIEEICNLFQDIEIKPIISKHSSKNKIGPRYVIKTPNPRKKS